MPRINRCVELLAEGQPIYYTGPTGRGYEGGKQSADTWADYISYDVEHHPFDPSELWEFMRGLTERGSTRSGHRSPAVIVSLPMEGISAETIRANSWVIKQCLAAGVHGLLLVHAEDPDAVRTFVEYCRYPFASKVDGLGEGRRGSGGQAHAAQAWGVDVRRYLDIADPWPLNPNGELLLGLKVENRHALARCEETLAIPGLAFAEWGPGDMGMSFGHADQHDPPYPPEMIDARRRVMAACKANGLAFLNAITKDDVIDQIEEGVRVCAGGGQEAAERGRRHTRRTMPF